MFCIALVSADPPFQTGTGEDFLILETPIIEYHQQSSDWEFHVHVYNSSNVLKILPNGYGDVKCDYDVYNPQTGEHTIVGDMQPKDDEWDINISSGNFSIDGQYSIIFDCKTTNLTENKGGFFQYDFQVTSIGIEFTTGKAILYSVIMIVSILTFMGLLWIGLALPSGNKTDEFTGYVIAVRNLKYLKYFLLGFSYITLLWINYFAWMITYAYLDFEFLANIFRFMFTFMAILTLPLFILFAWITISNLVRDIQVGDALMRGLRVK